MVGEIVSKFFRSKWLILILIVIDVAMFFAITYDELAHYLQPTMPNWAKKQVISDISMRFFMFGFGFSPFYFAYFYLLKSTLKDKGSPITATLLTAGFIAFKAIVMITITGIIYAIQSV